MPDEHHENSPWLLHLFIAVSGCASRFLFETSMVEQTSLVVQLGRNSLPSWDIHYNAHAFSIGFTRLGEGGGPMRVVQGTRTHTHGSRRTERPLFILCSGYVQGR